MSKSMLELVVGDFEEKRAYQQLMKRVRALPKEYRFAYKKVQHYLYCFGANGCSMEVFTDLAELFETGAAEGRPVSDVIGRDPAAFCDELISAANTDAISLREKLNQEIAQYFHKKQIQ